MDYANLRKQAMILNALCDAHEAIEAGKAREKVIIADERTPEQMEEIKQAELISYSNIVLASASGSLKSQLLGNLSDEPTLKAEDLVRLEIDEKLADEIIAESVVIRTDALALREPKEINSIAEEIEP